MPTHHKLIFGNCMDMSEIPSNSIHLMVTSPPYFNAPFDYKDLYKTYDQYLDVLSKVAKETYRVLQQGRIAVLNIDDMLVDGKKYPITADVTKIFLEAGFNYRDRIIWKKPDGYLRISKRSGVILQNPFPMYYYPDNLLESIIIFQKGKFNYKSIPQKIRSDSRINLKEFQDNKWYMTLWEMTNVLPGSPLEKNIAAFPEELPYRIISLFSYKNEIVLDPFVGSGTTMKVARYLGRNSIGIELIKDLEPIIREKVGFGSNGELFNTDDTFETIVRKSTKFGYISISEGKESRYMNISAEIKGIKYTPFLCSKMEVINLNELDKALTKNSAFILNVDSINKVAISWWVSPKRTRSYPYARVYNTLNFSGKKITIIPVIKDEGIDGERDYLQWDTISLMSLLGVYVIIGYYTSAVKNKRYDNKITNQRFDMDYILHNLEEIINYQSDALHWNLSQIDTIGNISEIALREYINIGNNLNVRMHSIDSAKKRIANLLKDKNVFMKSSRDLAKKAQKRESSIKQLKEFVTGEKGALTIKNYLGGYYFFTADEIKLDGDNIYLIECKHSIKGALPSIDDIKDGLLKMILFTNLTNVTIDNKKYNSKAVLKLTSAGGFDYDKLSKKQKKVIELLKQEKIKNNFELELL